MIEVRIPELCSPEIKYTFDCLLNEFLGLEYKLLIIPDQKGFIIDINGVIITIKNSFFDVDDIQKLYIINRIPEKVDKGTISIKREEFEITTIFGKVKLKTENNQFILDADIISSTFFMLSRWEEFANPLRDAHNRFAAKTSIAYKFKFLDRPIVNEYVELLWALFVAAGYKGKRKERRFTLVPTHDVDSPYMWNSTKGKLKSLASKVYSRRFGEFYNNIKLAIKKEDPFDNHNLFMDLSEEMGVKSHFFFMTGGNTSYDNRYKIKDKRIVNLIKKVEERGHEIGLHPSYNSYNNINFLKKEKEELEEVTKREVKTGRQHYLRFSISETWKLWDEMGMRWDSTLSYADCSGFRAGVCYPFSVFDIQKRKKLKLMERPLIAMEASVVLYEGLSLEAAKLKVDTLREQVSKYNGEFVFLWHNSSFNTKGYIPYRSLIYSMYGAEY